MSVKTEEKDRGRKEDKFLTVLLFSCQEKTLGCQEKTEYGHSKLGFECRNRGKRLGTKRKRILDCFAFLLSFSPARRKQKMVILSLVLSVKPKEKDWGPRENEFGSV